VIPRYAVLIDPAIPPSASFWTPTAVELEEDGAPGDFHDSELVHTDASEAEEVLVAERIAIEFLDATYPSAREFDDAASAIEFEKPDIPSDDAPPFMTELVWYGVNGLELGVSGLVHALNAAGIVTSASCRSHNQSHYPWSDYPIVVFAANREKLISLQPLVAASGCGFEIDDVNRAHLIAVIAPSVLEMMALGRAVLGSLSEEPH